MTPHRVFIIFLWLVALHSLCVGACLVFIPSTSAVISFFGYPYCEQNFFQKQGGVFHFIMVIIYILAIYRYRKEPVLVWLSVCAKGIGVIFLLSYFILSVQIWSVLISGIMDLMMGLAIWALYIRMKNAESKNNNPPTAPTTETTM
ncbi:MAG TPA: hypothetical protein P5531_03435 [Bacteroidales bacterium]|nr:hypothetical protein [Bacteroidales bacterium]HSA42427.1 hypothetical protein [Bacteroidales bacterium]